MIKFQDKADIGTARETKDGYLVAMSRIARTGVQEYRASELGFIGDHILRVNRAEDQVFSKDAMTSIAHAPVTIGHPVEMVDSDNWGELAVGEIGNEVMRDGEWLSVPLIVKDANAITAARTTHKEISMGYTANLVDAPEGADYDLDMKDISFNHLALVPKGRAGSEARIGDASIWGAIPVIHDKEVKMEMKPIAVGDAVVNVAASDVGVIQKLIADHAKAIEDKDTLIGELKAECKAANDKVLTDAQIEALVADRMAVVDKAKSLVADIDVSGKTVADIKREAVKSVYGDEAASADVSDAEINGIFRVMTPKKVNDDAREVLKDAKEVKDANKLIDEAIAKRFSMEAK